MQAECDRAHGAPYGEEILIDWASDHLHTQLNTAHRDFAARNCYTVPPARVVRPRDKTLCEASVDMVVQWIIAPSKDMTLYSLGEFNDCCADRIGWLSS